MSLAVGTYFTKSYVYSVNSWLEHIHAALDGFSGNLIVSTDESREASEAVARIRLKMGGWQIHHCQTPIETDAEVAYKEKAQLIITRIQHAAFSKARELGAGQFWSVESDILVPPNALKVSKQALEFDDGYYGIAMVTYPNGLFLGGRGTPQNHICEDTYQDERKIPKALKTKLKLKKNATPEQIKQWREAHEKIKECPPRANIFALQAKKWRKRGWLESAYPGIGRGAILPTDWVGLGCTLMGKKALSLATFDGYELQGTQDLFLCWNRWHPHDIRMCVIPHVLCSHVKKDQLPDGRRSEHIKVHFAYHEPTGECQGHVRWTPRMFIADANGSNQS